MKRLLICILTFLSIVFPFVSFAAENETVTEATEITYKGESIIYKNKNSFLFTSRILELVRSNFISNSEIAVSVVVDEYSGKGSQEGEYKVIFKAYNAETYLSKDIIIRVVDGLYSDYYFDNSFYSINKLTKENLVNDSKIVGLIPNVNCSTKIESDYFLEENTEVINQVNVIYASVSGLTGSYTCNINTLENPLYDLSDTPSVDNNPGTLGTIFTYCLVGGLIFIIFKFIIKKSKKRMFR